MERTAAESELTAVTRKLNGLIDAIAEGLRAPGLQQRLDDLEARKTELEAQLAAPAPSPVRLHPNLAQLYGEKSPICTRRSPIPNCAPKPWN